MTKKLSKTKKSATKSALKKLKCAWAATEVSEGWRLKLFLGQYNFKPEPNKVFKTIEAVENFCNAFDIKDCNIVFIHLKNTRFPTKDKL